MSAHTCMPTIVGEHNTFNGTPYVEVFTRCSVCGEEWYTFDQAEHIECELVRVGYLKAKGRSPSRARAAAAKRYAS